MTHGIRFLLAAIAMFVSTSGAYAEGCYTPSPTVQKGQDPYAPVKSRDLSRAEYQRLKTLFSSLDGNWKGTGSELFCRGSQDAPRKEIATYTIKARIRVDYYGNLILTAELYSEKNRTNHQENLYLYLKNKRLRVNSDDGAGDVELINMSTNAVAFFNRTLQPGAHYGGSLRRETFGTIHANNQVFTLKRNLYIHSKFNAQMQWQLKR